MNHRSVPASAPAGPNPAPDAQVHAAFRRLFELRSAELYRFAYRSVQSAETAKDLVHEAFLRLWRQGDQVDLGAPEAVKLWTAPG